MKRWWHIVGLIIAPALAYLPGLTSPFTHYDDPLYVWNNLDQLKPGGWAGLALQWNSSRAWGGDFVEFFPLRDSVYWALYQVFELATWPYHLTSLVFHIVTCFGLWLLLRRLGFDRGAYLGAMLFALHPVHIESVVWVAGMKDPMYTGFMVWGLYAYASYRQQPAWWKYLAMLLCLIAAFLVKSLVVVMPLIMLAMELCFPPRVSWKELASRLTAPFIVSGVFFLQILLIGKANHVITPPHGGSWLSHYIIVLWAQAKYLKQAVLPTSYRLIYCFEPPEGLTDWRLWVGLAVVLGMLALAFVWRQRRNLLFFVAFYVLAMAPVSNLVPFPAIMADRYLYAASIGVCGLAGALLNNVRGRVYNFALWSVLLLMTVATASRAWLWHDEEALWEEPDLDPACVLDSSFPAAQAHVLRFITTNDAHEGLMALERAMVAPGFLKIEEKMRCDALTSAAGQALNLGSEERALHWAKLSNKVCPTNAESWNMTMMINLRINPPVAAMAARRAWRLAPGIEAETLAWLTQLPLKNSEAPSELLRLARRREPASCFKIIAWANEWPDQGVRLAQAVEECLTVPTPAWSQPAPPSAPDSVQP